MPTKKVLSIEVAKAYIEEVKQTISSFKVQPTLVGFLANEDPAARKYAEWTGRTCQETGIKFELRVVKRTELENAIVEANEDKNVNGIMVYYPVFGGGEDQYLQNTVSTSKDVEGLCHKYRYNMYHNIRYLDDDSTQKCIIPCTPLAVVKILEHIGVYNKILPYGDRLHGKVITVINRSEVVGRPLAALLANDGARVYSADEFGLLKFDRGENIKLARHTVLNLDKVSESDLQLEQALTKSDVVITGVPSDKYQLPAAGLKDGVVLVNFSTFQNIGAEAQAKASIYVPSVGKVTIAMLQRNLGRLFEYQTK